MISKIYVYFKIHIQPSLIGKIIKKKFFFWKIPGSGSDNAGRSVSSVRLGQEFDVDVDAIAATMQGHSKGNK